MIDWCEDLVQAIARRKSVIVIGSGVSRNSENAAGKQPASWEEFLRNCSADLQNPEYIGELIDRRDYLTACELIKRVLTPDIFVDKVQREYQRPGYTHALIHEHIYNLDSAIVASPNFDHIYDTYASNISAGSIVTKDHTSRDLANYLLGGEVRLLIKTHGSANNPQEVIFTRADYARARTEHVLFYEIFKALVLTHTFLFIGCGIDDPDVRMLFEDVQFAHGRMPFHYMTLPQGEFHTEILAMASESMRIRFLEYSPEDRHAELTESLGELVRRVEEYRQQKAEDRKW